MKKYTIDDLKFDPNNARAHPDVNKAQIRASLEDVGAFRSIAMDGEGIIRAGNGVLEQAREMGLTIRVVETAPNELVVVHRPDLVGEQAERAALWDNRAAESSEWDLDVLATIEAEHPEVLEGIFTADDLANLFAEKGGGAQSGLKAGADPDEIPDNVETRCKRGDLWVLGNHRLLCGDSTVPTDVDRLMDGARASCMWTDPPYGVKYVGKTKDALTIENDGADGLQDLLRGFLLLATGALSPGAPFYMAHPAGALCLTFGNAIMDVGWKFHQTLIWVKDSMVLGHSDYHFRHEPIYYGWTPGEGRCGRGNHEGSRWQGDHSQVSVFEIPRPKRSESHPTMKPVALIRAMLANSVENGAAVYDPFCGSGSTLITCEDMGLACYAIELTPTYCDVILARWEEATGQVATRLIEGSDDV